LIFENRIFIRDGASGKSSGALPPEPDFRFGTIWGFPKKLFFQTNPIWMLKTKHAAKQENENKKNLETK